MKPKVRAVKYERTGSPLAIAPKAFYETFFMLEDPARENVDADGAVIVDIRDPLEQHAHFCFDSYEEILARVDAACASGAGAVILRFDSPGGEAAGCFESARAVRAKCDAAGKGLHAYIEGDCCSAAYAFAAVCESVTIGDTALCGSVGVVVCRDDYSAQNAARGVRVAYVTSGARKADGHPDNPITDAELAAMQSIVDAMGLVFFEHVATSRGLAVESIAQLEAKILHGQAAVQAGLADEVGSLATVLARIAGGVKGNPNMNAYQKARAALEEAAKGDDANALAAKKALAAMGTDGGGDDPPAGDPPADDPKPKPDTAGDPPPAGDPKTDEEKKAAAAASTSAYRVALAAQAEASAARAELKTMREDTERAKLIASRPGMDANMVALLEAAPIELVREHIKKMPETPINPVLAGMPTRGHSQTVPGLPPDEKTKLDIKMGIVPATPQNQSTETKLVLSARRAPAPVAPPVPGALPNIQPGAAN